MLPWWEGWGGVGHVSVMFMLRWCYVDGRGGVGVGHVHVTLMLRWWEGWGGGGACSCSCYVDATLMGFRVAGGDNTAEALASVTKRQLRRHGLISVTSDSIEHRNLLAVHHINKKPGLHTVLTALKKIRELSLSSLQPASKVWDQASWKLWKRKCCSRLMKLKQQRAKKGWLSTCAVSC